MDDLKDLREEIDLLDDQIMDLLNKRMEVSKRIGLLKIKNNLNITNNTREEEIKQKTKQFTYTNSISNIYDAVFLESKKLQNYDYFLIGKTLNYSFSPLIYKSLGIDNYNLLATDDFEIIKKINFKFANVTNPYKELALKICDEIDEIAKRTNVVNLIINKNNKLYGYNTDYLGFKSLIEVNNININGKKVIIIGNGATSRTVSLVLNDLGAKSIIHLVRSVRSNNEYLISEFEKFKDYEIIINTTPYGTYPNLEEEPLFNIDGFLNLEAVIDVVYNPFITPLVNAGINKNIKSVSGLLMLVSQAVKAISLYENTNKENLIIDIYKKLKFDLTNIILIGMPYSGKSTLGEKLKFVLNHKFVDIDKEMEKDKCDLISILDRNGTVDEFRRLETIYSLKFAKEHGLIIATGGGVINSKEAMSAYQKNGIIVYLNTKLEDLESRLDDKRPLATSINDLRNLYEQRKSLYENYANIVITDTNDIKEIVRKVYEYLNN